MRKASIESCDSNLRVSKIMALQKTIKRGLFGRIEASGNFLLCSSQISRW